MNTFATPPAQKSEERAPTLFQASDLRGALALARDWGAIVLAAVVSIRSHNVFVYVAAAATIACFQFALGESLIHEASHFHLFRTRSWNDRFEFLYALPFFMSVAQFREEHLAHHLNVGTPQDQLMEDYRFIGLFQPRVDMFRVWFLKPLAGFPAYFYLTKLSLKPLRCGAKVLGFWALVLGAAAYLGALKIVALYWLVPLWTGHVAFLYWSEIQDHFGTRSGTRTVIGALGNWLWHNNGYHAVHHARAAVPWYGLPEAHAEFVLKGGPHDISTGFFDTYRQLREAAASGAATAA